MKFKAVMVCVSLVGLGGLAPAATLAATGGATQAAPDKAAAMPLPASQTSAAAQGYTEAEVKKIDVAQGKVVLKHGPIDNLGMPSMTMVFRADAPVLATLQVGDRVRFKADKVDGAFKVTELLGK